MHDLERERRIQEQLARMCAAEDRNEQRHHMRQMYQLINERRPEAVEQMEMQKGLR